jgi:hypothetical protein
MDDEPETLAQEKAVARELLGWEGRMISGSKTGYRREHPDHAAIFNANVCIGQGKLWHGDLDLTLDEPRLRELVERLGTAVFVLYERDGRFEYEEHPRFAKAPFRFWRGGDVRFDPRIFKRADDGTLRWLTRKEREARRAAEGE